MTKIINKNIISIKIGDKKKSKRRKRHSSGKSSHINAPYSNVSSLITNRSQQLDTSTLANREKESIITNAINTVRRDNEILAIMDKKTKPPPLLTFESPKPPPTILKPTKTPKKITNINPSSEDNNLYNVYPENKKTNYDDRFEVLDEYSKRGKGRPFIKKTNETGEEFINRIKKGKSATAYRKDKDFTITNKDIIPPPSSYLTPVKPKSPMELPPPRSKEFLSNIHKPKKDTKHEAKFLDKITRAMNDSDYFNENKESLKEDANKDTARAQRVKKRSEKTDTRFEKASQKAGFL